MHPGFFGWWKAQHQGGSCGPQAYAGEGAGRCGPRAAGPAPWQAGGHDDGAPFGVRRPLRVMAHKLGLSQEQVDELAIILNDIKTERAQAAVDGRRRLSLIAEALDGDALDEAKLASARALEIASTERVEAAVKATLERTHKLLTPEQRHKLAQLLRTGALTI